MVNKTNIFWSQSAREDLKEIYGYYKRKSLQAAKNIKKEILAKAANIKYPKQYQADDTDENYRRMIVRHYKILYSYQGNKIYINKIFDVRQNPSKQIEDSPQ